MNGSNQIDKKLDELFAKAKQLEPLLTNKEVHTLISHAPTSAFPGKQLVKFFNNHLKFIIMSTIVSAFLISVFLWNPFIQVDNKGVVKKNNQVTILKNKKTETTLASELIKVDSIEQDKHHNSEKNAMLLNDISKKSIYNASEIFNNRLWRKTYHDTTLIYNDNTASNPDSSTCNCHFYGDEYILSLTIEEFCKLGFTFTDSVFYNYNIATDSSISGYTYYNEKVKPEYMANNSFSNFRWYNYAKNLEKSTLSPTKYDFYPVYITDRFDTQRIRYINFTKEDKKRIRTNDLRRKELKINQSQVFYKRISDDYTINHNKNQYSPSFEVVNDTLVPVTISNDVDLSSSNVEFKELVAKTNSEKIFWFKCSPSFYNNLPKRYSSKTKAFYENIKTLKRKTCNNKNIVEYSSIDLIKNTITNIRKIELTPAELKRLGFFITDNWIYYQNKLNDSCRLHVFADKMNFSISPDYNKYNNNENSNANIGFDFNGNNPSPFPHFDFYPMFITDTEGYRTVKDPVIYNDKIKSSVNNPDLYFLDNINRLIAIKINKDLVKENHYQNGFIFWFTPTEALFDSLPSKIGNDLRNEYRALLLRTDPDVPQVIKEKTPAVCTYFEECRPTYPEMSNLKVYPNPSKNLVNIEFSLNKPDEVRIMLFDIEGRLLKILKDSEEVPAGFNHIDVSVKNLPDGIYILTIQNNNGNYKTQRIIKQ